MNVSLRIKILSCFLLLVCAITKSNAQEKRVIVGINGNWKFHRGGIEYADKPGFNDAKWDVVNLPHTWNASDPFDDDETYFRGIGWYRKTIELDTSFQHKKVYLLFEGANQVTDVYINGGFAGEHRGGYTSFSFDITQYLNWGTNPGKNVIAIQVNNAHDNYIPPLSVGYALYGGIYRDAWLIATDDVHFKEINNNDKGIFITTPGVNVQSSAILVKTSIINESHEKRTFRFLNTVKDSDGKIVTRFSKEISLDAGQGSPISVSSEIHNPHLWSPDDPYLYQVISQITEDNKVLDEVKNSLGFRWFHFDPSKGFFLNGKKYILHGTNRHQDMKGKGSALSSEDHIRDMHFIKEMGGNFVRLAHYPQAPEVLKLADELGIIIWEEIPVVNYMNIEPEFLSNAENMLREMIHQNFNHPSIIMWGSMNEVLLDSKKGDRIQKQNDTAYLKGVRKYALQLDSLIRAEDPSRYTTMAMHESDDYAKYRLDDISQVAGHNIYSGWYGGKVDGFGRFLDNLHREKPQQIIFVSEYGAEGDIQLNTEKPERMDYTGQYQCFYHESYIRQINQRPYLGGTAIWNEFDFSQPNIGGPTPHRNQKGLITWDRKPKDVYYLYKANWNPEPMVYIATRNWIIRAGESTAASTIDVYSNLSEVTLYVNGESEGKQKPDDVKKSSWQVHLKNGKNTISAAGKINGKTFQDEVIIEYREYNTNLASEKRFHPISVNVGSNAQYLDPSGNIWIEDRPYDKGSFGYVSGNRENFVRTKVIKNTNDVPLYYTSRDSLKAYRLDVKDGQYTVTLCFVENKDIPAGERIFDVDINNETVIKNLDLASEYGYAHAAKRSFILQVTNGQGITVSFKPIKGNATLSGIKVEQ